MLKLIFGVVVSIVTLGNPGAEIVVTWVMFTIDLVLNLLDIVASIAIFITFAVIDGVKWYDGVSFTIGLLASVAFTVLDAVSAPSAGGSKLGHPVAIAIFAIWAVVANILGVVVLFFDVIILALQFAGVIT